MKWQKFLQGVWQNPTNFLIDGVNKVITTNFGTQITQGTPFTAATFNEMAKGLTYNLVDTSTTANALECLLDGFEQSNYSADNKFLIIPNNAITGASTLKINTLATVSIKKNGNVDLEAGDIVKGQPILLVYNSIGYLQLVNKDYDLDVLNLQNSKLGKTEKAADSEKLDNRDGSEYCLKGVPAETVITTGFAPGWSGTVRYRITQEGLRIPVLTVERTTDLPTTTDTIITIPELATTQPFGISETHTLWTASFATRVQGALGSVTVDGSGNIKVASIGTVTANAKALNGAVLSYF